MIGRAVLSLLALLFGLSLAWGQVAVPRIAAPKFAGGGGGGRTISFVGQASMHANGGTFNVSSVANQAGDLCVVHNSAAMTTGTPPTSVTPSGYAQIGTSASGTGFGTGQRWNVFYKVLTAAETSISIMNGDYNDDALYMCFRKSGGTWGTPAGLQNIADMTGNFPTSPTSYTVTSGSGTAPLVVIGGWAAFVNSSPTDYSLFGDAGTTPAYDGVYFDGNNGGGAYKIWNTSPANMTIGTRQAGSMIALAGYYIPLGP